MPVIIKYTQQQYQNKSQKIESLVNRLGEKLILLENYRTESYEFWDDEIAEATRRTLGSTIEKVRNAQERAKNILQANNEIINKLESTNTLVYGSVSDALEMVQKLDS